ATHQDSASAAPAREVGRTLIEAGTCLSCHQLDKKSIGPAYTAVAQRYRGDTSASRRLATKIRAGGSGVWGSVMMPAHPQLTETQASQMVAYILSLGDAKKATPSLPTRGTFTPPVAAESASQGVLTLRATYTDLGANGLPGVTAEKALVLRAPRLVVASGQVEDGVQKYKGPEVPVEVTIGTRSGAYVGFRQIDLTGVSSIVFAALAPIPQLNAAGGIVEVRVDSAKGTLVGATPPVAPDSAMGAPKEIRAPIAATGVHDLYFVFRNEQAKSGQNLF